MKSYLKLLILFYSLFFILHSSFVISRTPLIIALKCYVILIMQTEAIQKLQNAKKIYTLNALKGEKKMCVKDFWINRSVRKINKEVLNDELMCKNSG